MQVIRQAQLWSRYKLHQESIPVLNPHSLVSRASASYHTVSSGMTGPGFKSHQCLLTGTWMRMPQLPCWLPERTVGVVPEVNLRKCVTHTPLPSMNKAANSGFEIYRRHHQKSKTRVSVAPQ